MDFWWQLFIRLLITNTRIKLPKWGVSAGGISNRVPPCVFKVIEYGIYHSLHDEASLEKHPLLAALNNKKATYGFTLLVLVFFCTCKRRNSFFFGNIYIIFLKEYLCISRNRNKHQTFIKDRLRVWLLLVRQSGKINKHGVAMAVGLTYIQFELIKTVARRCMTFFSLSLSLFLLSCSSPSCFLFLKLLSLLSYLAYIHIYPLLHLLLRYFSISIFLLLFLFLSSVILSCFLYSYVFLLRTTRMCVSPTVLVNWNGYGTRRYIENAIKKMEGNEILIYKKERKKKDNY